MDAREIITGAVDEIHCDWFEPPAHVVEGILRALQLIWRKAPPTEPGWYWCYHKNNPKHKMVIELKPGFDPGQKWINNRVWAKVPEPVMEVDNEKG